MEFLAVARMEAMSWRLDFGEKGRFQTGAECVTSIAFRVELCAVTHTR
jgi:hypothetical protein